MMALNPVIEKPPHKAAFVANGGIELAAIAGVRLQPLHIGRGGNFGSPALQGRLN